MKKILFSIILVIFLNYSLLFGEECFQQIGAYYEVAISTSIAVVVSSTTITTIPEIRNGIGLQRIFKIYGSPSANLLYQYGGSTTTVATNGLDLEAHTYLVEDKYFGDIYFQSDSGDVNLRYQIIKKT